MTPQDILRDLFQRLFDTLLVWGFIGTCVVVFILFVILVIAVSLAPRCTGAGCDRNHE